MEIANECSHWHARNYLRQSKTSLFYANDIHSPILVFFYGKGFMCDAKLY